MSNGGVCRAALATPGLLNGPENVHVKISQSLLEKSLWLTPQYIFLFYFPYVFKVKLISLGVVGQSFNPIHQFPSDI